MNNDLLSGVEKNIEIQATGLLAQAREEFAFSAARGENSKLKLADRIRSCLGSTIEVQVIDFGWHSLKVLQVASDHFVASDLSRLFLIKFSSLIALKGLAKGAKPPNRIDNSWHINSTLRKWMIEQDNVSIFLKNHTSYSGKIKKIYLDHFELSTEIGVIALSESEVLMGVKSGEE